MKSIFTKAAILSLPLFALTSITTLAGDLNNVGYVGASAVGSQVKDEKGKNQNVVGGQAEFDLESGLGSFSGSLGGSKGPSDHNPNTIGGVDAVIPLAPLHDSYNTQYISESNLTSDNSGHLHITPIAPGIGHVSQSGKTRTFVVVSPWDYEADPDKKSTGNGASVHAQLMQDAGLARFTLDAVAGINYGTNRGITTQSTSYNYQDCSAGINHCVSVAETDTYEKSSGFKQNGVGSQWALHAGVLIPIGDLAYVGADAHIASRSMQGKETHYLVGPTGSDSHLNETDVGVGVKLAIRVN